MVHPDTKVMAGTIAHSFESSPMSAKTSWQITQEIPSELGWVSDNIPLQSSEDHVLARALLAQVCIDRNGINRAILHAEHIIDSLKRYREEQTARAGRLRGAISVFRSFPDELLIDIFKWCGLPEVPLPPNQSSYPWNISQVCSKWRRNAWKSTVIQNCVKVIWLPHSGESQNFTNMKAVVENLLSYTDANFSINSKTSPGGPLLRILPAFRGRILDLTYHHFDDQSVNDLGAAPPDIFGSLERLELLFAFRRHESISDARDTTPFQTAPQLRDVTYVGNLTFSRRAQILLLPWRQLTRLSIVKMYLSLDFIYTSLSQCDSLVSCILRKVRVTAASTSTPVLVPSLQSLEILDWDASEWPSLLDPLVLPSMVNLVISSDRVHPGAITSLLKRSKCKLERLIMTSRSYMTVFALSDVDIVSLMQELPCVVEIKAMFPVGTTSFQMMKPHLWLPCLERAEFRIFPETFMDMLSWLDWQVEQKQLDASNLSDVHIECSSKPRYPPSPERQELYELAGIRLVVEISV